MSNRRGIQRRVHRQCEPVVVLADYKPAPLGGWSATVTLPELPALPARSFQAADPHAVFHFVLDELKRLADGLARPMATVHTLDGDPAAFAQLAAVAGFAGCAQDEDHDIRIAHQAM